jgi:NAD(P)H-quinone oxidoreductase subunit 5
VPSLLSGLLGGALATQVKAEYHLHFVGLTPIVASSLALVGLAASVAVFGKGGTAPLAATLERLDAYSAVDRFWAGAYRIGLLGVASVLGWIDRYVIDGLINLSGYATIAAGAAVRKLQTGRVRDYALAVAAGAAAAVLFVVLR